MHFFQAIDIESFVNLMIYHDKEITRICSGWEIEKEEVCEIVVRHFNLLGIFMSQPFAFSETLRKEIIHQLLHSPEIQKKRAEIQQEINKAREKNRNRVGP